MKRLNQEKGAVSLLTLAFLSFAGVALLSFLWAVVQTNGAYRTLAATTDSAAYAAVGTTGASGEGNENIVISCFDDTVFFGNISDFDPNCTRDKTTPERNAPEVLRTIDQVFSASFAPKDGQTKAGAFGLCYQPFFQSERVCPEGSSIIHLTVAEDEPDNLNNLPQSLGIQVFNYSETVYGLPQSEDTCAKVTNKNWGTFDIGLGLNKGLCWDLPGKDRKDRIYYSPGVIVRAVVNFRYPICSRGIADLLGGVCESKQVAYAVSTQTQPIAPGGY